MTPYSTVLPITWEPRPGISPRIDVAPTAENGPRSASQVMVDWPQTVRFADMGAAIGKLHAATMRRITRQMAVVLGIGGGGPRRTGAAGAGLVRRG